MGSPVVQETTAALLQGLTGKGSKIKDAGIRGTLMMIPMEISSHHRTVNLVKAVLEMVNLVKAVLEMVNLVKGDVETEISQDNLGVEEITTRALLTTDPAGKTITEVVEDGDHMEIRDKGTTNGINRNRVTTTPKTNLTTRKMDKTTVEDSDPPTIHMDKEEIGIQTTNPTTREMDRTAVEGPTIQIIDKEEISIQKTKTNPTTRKMDKTTVEGTDPPTIQTPKEEI